MVDFLSRLFDTSDFPPRWYCGAWTAGHGWLHILADLSVWSAYVAIPCVLGFFVLRRRDIPFRSIFLLFGAFDPRRGSSLIADLTYIWLSVTVSMLVLASLFYLLALPQESAPSRLFYAYFYGVDLFLLCATHTVVFQVLSSLRKRGRHLRRVLLVGGGVHGRQVAVRLQGQEGAGLALAGCVSSNGDALVAGVPKLGEPDEILDIVRRERIDEVVIALPATSHTEALNLSAQLQNVADNVRQGRWV